MNVWDRLHAFFRRDLWAADFAALGPLARVRVRILRLLVVTVWEFQESFLSLRATSLVYTTLLSLVPFLAVTFSVLKAFGIHHQAEPFLAQLFQPLGERGAEVTRRVIEFVDNLKVGVLGAVGVAGLFYTVISLLEKVEGAFNSIWRIRRPRSLGRKFSDYLSVVLVGPVLVFAAFALTASAQSHWLVQRVLEIEPLGTLIVPVASRVIPFVFLAAAFTFIYKFVPYTQVTLSSALVGGITAGLLWQLAGTAFAAFVAQSPRYTAIYSGFAVVILFLIWLYVAWVIILVGAQVAYFHQYPAIYLTQALRQSGTQLFREWLALSALSELTRRHLAGAVPWRTDELAAALAAPPSSLDDLLDELVRRGIVFRTAEPEGVALGRRPEQVTAVEVLDAVRGPGIVSAEPYGEADDGVAQVLRRRDEAVRQALEGTTLRDLALEGRSEPTA